MMEAVSLVCQLFGALVLAVNVAPNFWWGDTGQHVEVGRMHPVMRRHVSFNVVSTSWRCVERAQTGQQYSATERHSAVAVVLMVWGHAPQFVPCSFLRRLFLEESFARVLRQWFRYRYLIRALYRGLATY